MAPEMKTIRIAGGGLAGLSLGIALRLRQVPVVVHEALHYPRHRVCGEFISGVKIDTLEKLGIRDFLKNASRPNQAMWWSHENCLGTFALPEAAYAVSRYHLDHQLSCHLRKLGGTIHEDSRLQPSDAEGTVWSAGRRPAQGPWIGLKAHIRNIDLRAGLEMHLGDKGYVGMVEVEEGWTNICGIFPRKEGLTRKDRPLLVSYLDAIGLSAVAERLISAKWRENSQSAVAGFQLGVQSRLPHLVRIGDSHSIIPPFTGNGMSMALEAAELALEPLIDYAHRNTSWSETMQRIEFDSNHKFHRRLQLAGVCQHLLLAPWFRKPLEILALEQLLPFHSLFTLTRH
jgi:2-polyprenyl-6-methoxyphenol hydroxylase-like FAD-dependent oxidoreductase